MTQTHTQNKIAEEIAMVFDEFYAYIEKMPNAMFLHSQNGKWSPAAHLSHLIKSAQPLNFVLNMPKITLLLFGTNKREGSRRFEELVEKYQNKLKEGAKASGTYLPEDDLTVTDKHILLADFEYQKRKLIENVQGMKEEDMDYYLLPHPILGKLTIREMLYFTIYHVSHHHKSLKDNAL